jgi:hypothetical protein
MYPIRNQLLDDDRFTHQEIRMTEKELSEIQDKLVEHYQNDIEAWMQFLLEASRRLPIQDVFGVIEPTFARNSKEVASKIIEYFIKSKIDKFTGIGAALHVLSAAVGNDVDSRIALLSDIIRTLNPSIESATAFGISTAVMTNAVSVIMKSDKVM